MKQTVLFFALCFAALCHAQDGEGDFGPESIVYVLGDSINLREQPDRNAPVVAQLPLGTRLKVLEQGDLTLKMNGIDFPWYFVELTPKKRGWIWGGKLAMQSFRSSKNPDIVFHFGVDRKVDETYVYQVRVEKDHRELQRVLFDGFGHPGKHRFTNRSNCGLTNVDDVLYMDGDSEFCGDSGGSVVLFWSGGTLYHVTTLNDFFDAPVFASEVFYFPSDMEGRKGEIILHETAGGYYTEAEWIAEQTSTEMPERTEADEDATLHLSKDEKTTFRWDGKELKKK